MFTGIVESLGQVSALKKDKGNLNVTIKSHLAKQLKVDQSLAHNGVCLTVVELFDDDNYRVTAINETIEKSNFKTLAVGDFINLERAMVLGARLDGHIVQGHVDQTAMCTNVADANGSFVFTFEYDASINNITIEKGSITVNGVSLTVVNSKNNRFSVAVIPYTLQHTNFNSISKGSIVNLEFDVIGKYVAKLLKG